MVCIFDVWVWHLADVGVFANVLRAKSGRTLQVRV